MVARIQERRRAGGGRGVGGGSDRSDEGNSSREAESGRLTKGD